MEELYSLLRSKARVESSRIVVEPGWESIVEEFKDAVVDSLVKGMLEEASAWIELFVEEASRAQRLLGASGWLLPKEMKSFIEDPRRHLRKKLFQYTMDLIRGRLSLEEYMGRARSALVTSVRTNARSLYQSWVFAAILANMAEREGASIVYPEHGFILVERTGRQRGGSIPPDLVVRSGRGEISFFLEAPRPIGWGDGGELARSWRLYTSLRPDMLVYSGRVIDIVDLESRGAPIKRPNIVVECKESPDWFERQRYLKGILEGPLRAEEWYSRWLEGLYEGLADILDIDLGVGDSRSRQVRALKVKEYRLVQLYKETFRPDVFILVSRARLPRSVVADLESRGITVLHGVEMGRPEMLSEAAEIIMGIAGGERLDIVEEARARLRRAGIEASREVVEWALKILIDSRFEELAGIITRYGREAFAARRGLS